MPNAVEYLPFEQRLVRLNELAAGIVAVLRENSGTMALMEALRASATALRVAMSQVKYGLTYALSAGMVTVDDRAATVSVTSA